jgi:hypothetical protein
MKKLLLILLCVPLIFSCGEETDNLDRKITREMMDDGYTGKGTYGWGEGGESMKYVGEWKDGRIEGQGTYIYMVHEQSGDQLIGKFSNGDLHGQGTYTFADGRIYIGEFYENCPFKAEFHGKGKMTYPDGKVKEGLWENGEFIGE